MYKPMCNLMMLSTVKNIQCWWLINAWVWITGELILKGENRIVLREKSVLVSLSPPHDMAWDPSWVYMMTGWWISARAMAWPYSLYETHHFLKADSQKGLSSKIPTWEYKLQIMASILHSLKFELLMCLHISYKSYFTHPFYAGQRSISLTSELINLNMKVRESHL